ncbi:NADH dehydrogenase [ubiquinone] 1 beta subcomplex subunit 11, mitochondrial-like [Uloborus diversus]|uniref:NADH dehydrogenase [ubiquinone] 1 beta subcomplex subunit 11, mitochondrial-like n=1 Tax=Uloborus diversus TaxID=327109 RepID=UPI002409E496|nr:NADH dehydrogenase [ubiquinone] 1 beta subcomplex subunit 11, mitochondrial-like [Uloborus diversus]
MAFLCVTRNAGLCLRKIPKMYALKVSSISTSKKNKDTLVYPDDLFPKKIPPGPKTVEDFANPKTQKSWISYGYDFENYEEDRFLHKISTFLCLTVLVCGATFAIAYIPDLKERDWVAREAQLRLHERESRGLPLIDKNYIDPAKIDLPTDEELGDTEIII